MRILAVHERYRQRAGEDYMYESENSLLESYGHEVRRLEVDNQSIPDTRSLWQSVRLGASTVWSEQGRRIVEKAVQTFSPDVAHFYNTFPLLSPAAYSPCKAEGVPVIQRVPNYRPICPSAELFRDGQICTDCVGKFVAWPGVAHACRNGSRAESLAVAAMIAAHRVRGTWQRDVDLYVAPSRATRELLVIGGLPEKKVVVKPNFIDSDPGHSPQLGSGFLFVGRLYPGKGIETLLRAWEGFDDTPLRIVGDGPLRGLVERFIADHKSVEMLGWVDRAEVFDEMRRCYGLIFPSEWYEPFGITIIEALAVGRPVIGSRLGAIPEIVDHSRNGLLFSPGDSEALAESVTWAIDNEADWNSMAAEARAKYELEYTSARSYSDFNAQWEMVRPGS